MAGLCISARIFLSLLLLLLAPALSASLPLGGSTYLNPVVNSNTPDPGVLYVPDEGLYYAVTTSNLPNETQIFPIRISKDLVNWKLIGYIFDLQTAPPAWAVADFWAPEIHFLSGSFRLYYAGRDSTGVLCIGAAKADRPAGPWTDSPAPLVRDPSVGNIDATFYLDQTTTPSTPYLVWKVDGNGAVPPRPTPILAQPLSKSGLSFAANSQPVELFHNTLPWEGNLVEGPWVVPRSPYVYVIYSANAFYNASYAMGVARAPINSFLGPYTKFPDPLVHSNNVWIGPGHCSVVSSYVDPARTFLVYHSYKAGEVGGNYNRVLLVDELKWDDVNRWPYVTSDSPSIVPQRLPIRN